MRVCGLLLGAGEPGEQPHRHANSTQKVPSTFSVIIMSLQWKLSQHLIKNPKSVQSRPKAGPRLLKRGLETKTNLMDGQHFHEHLKISLTSQGKTDLSVIRVYSRHCLTFCTFTSSTLERNDNMEDATFLKAWLVPIDSCNQRTLP